MSNQPRVEEVSDSDPEEMDISDVASPPPATNTTLTSPSNIPMQAGAGMVPRETEEQKRERTKNWQCLYPLYFDASRTLSEGRRVGKDLAVRNPLAREIVDAIYSLGLQIVFEPGKTHPKDWSNPGRVKVLVKQNGKPVSSSIPNKHQLYIHVAKYLQANPTTTNSPLKLKIPGMPPPKKAPPPPAVPRGWKMGRVLPLHSPAVTGGGVSDNLFKEMMAEMQGQGEEPASGSGKSKKDKKKIKG